MEKIIDFDQLKNEIIKYQKKITILSTDVDQRFDEAKKLLQKEIANIAYIQIDQKFIDNYNPDKKNQLLELYKKIRLEKEPIEILNHKFLDPNYFANLLLLSGKADAIVSGATHPTSDILRPAFQIIKTKNKDEIISSFMWLKKAQTKDLFMSDISVNPNPSAKELAEIAIQTANSIEKIFKIVPVIAMLSFSTLGSGGKNPLVQKVQKATKLVQENSNYEVVGEIQFDAAYKEEIFKTKVKNLKLTKLPNLFVFPDLNSANISYKIAAHLGNYEAIGPLLQNITKPINDLSRGASAREIADLVILTALQVINF